MNSPEKQTIALIDDPGQLKLIKAALDDPSFDKDPVPDDIAEMAETTGFRFRRETQRQPLPHEGDADFELTWKENPAFHVLPDDVDLLQRAAKHFLVSRGRVERLSGHDSARTKAARGLLSLLDSHEPSK